jgi:CRP/FNR family transcriptional regulator
LNTIHNINLEEMGRYAGIVREAISRKRQLFDEMGLIKLLGAKKILMYESGENGAVANLVL